MRPENQIMTSFLLARIKVVIIVAVCLSCRLVLAQSPEEVGLPYEKPKTEAQADSRCGPSFVETFKAKIDCFLKHVIGACAVEHDRLSSLGGAVGASSGAALGLLAGLSLKPHSSSADAKFLEDLKKTYRKGKETQYLIEKVDRLAQKATLMTEEKLYEEQLGKKPKRTALEVIDKEYPGQADLEFAERLHRERFKYLLKDPNSTVLQNKGDVSFTQKKLTDETKAKFKKVMEELVNATGIKQLQELIKKVPSDQEVSTGLKRSLSAEGLKYAKSKMGPNAKKYEELAAANDRKIDEVIKKADPNFEAGMKKLIGHWYHADGAELETGVSRAISDYVADHEKIVRKHVVQEHLRFANEIYNQYPELYLAHEALSSAKYNTNGSKLLSSMDLPFAGQIKARMLAAKVESVVFHGVTGGFIGAFAGEGMRAYEENKVERCSEELKMSDEEVRFLRTRMKHKKGLSCLQMRLLDPSAAIVSAEAEWGFIPVGMCEMLLRENQVLTHLSSAQGKLSEISCEKIDFQGGTSLRTGRQPSFTCSDSVTKMSYTLPILNSQIEFDPKQISAVLLNAADRGVDAPVAARELAAKFEKMRGGWYQLASDSLYAGATVAGISNSRLVDEARCGMQANSHILGNKIMRLTCGREGTTPGKRDSAPIDSKPGEKTKSTEVNVGS